MIAFDPYVPRERGKEMGVELMPTLEALLVQADFLTIHLPRTPDTEGLIGERELALMKEGARLVNTARGGIVDEQALAKALEEGKLAGAALDVFEQEPAEDSPLFAFEQVVATPHLGASTTEAQDKAGASIAEMVRLALNGEFVPYAVNVSAGAEVPETVRRSSRSPNASARSSRGWPTARCARWRSAISAASARPTRACSRWAS